MENNETTKALNQFCALKERELKALISSKHSKTGKLEKSIRLFAVSKGNGFAIEFEGLEYIKYLDDGNFLKDFLADMTKELTEVIASAIKKDILNDLNK